MDDNVYQPWIFFCNSSPPNIFRDVARYIVWIEKKYKNIFWHVWFKIVKEYFLTSEVSAKKNENKTGQIFDK